MEAGVGFCRVITNTSQKPHNGGHGVCLSRRERSPDRSSSEKLGKSVNRGVRWSQIARELAFRYPRVKGTKAPEFKSTYVVPGNLGESGFCGKLAGEYRVEGIL